MRGLTALYGENEHNPEVGPQAVFLIAESRAARPELPTPEEPLTVIGRRQT
jgi:hypothetical protein